MDIDRPHSDEPPEERAALEEALQPYLARWEQVWEANGQDLAASELCNDGTPEFLLALGEAIQMLKSFPALPDAELSHPDDDAGRFAADQYEGIGSIGEGGQGRVIRAKDVKLGRVVAVKHLKRHWLWKPELQRQLEREARITGKLEHPGVVPVYGFGHDDQGRPYYAMRYMEDESTFENMVTQLYAEPDRQRRAVALRGLLRRFVVVCHTIDYAHGQDVINRDIKPQNILLGQHEEVFVADWGLAKGVVDSSANLTITDDTLLHHLTHPGLSLTGNRHGTLAYMSPEQATEGADVDKASDIFSLGATLYHLLTGQAPYRDETRSRMLDRIRTAEIVHPRAANRDIPLALEAICKKAMRLDPADRYATAGDFARDVSRWLDGEPVAAYPEPWRDRLRRWIKRHQTFATTIAAAVIIALICCLVAALLIDKARRREQTAKENLAVATDQLRAQNTELQRPHYATQLALAEQFRQELDLDAANRVLDSTLEELRGIEWSYLKAAVRRSDLIDVAHDASMAALSHDGSRLAVAVQNTLTLQAEILLIDTQTESIHWRHQVPSAAFRSLKFSQKDQRLDVIYVKAPEAYPRSAFEAIQQDKNSNPADKSPNEQVAIKSWVVKTGEESPAGQAAVDVDAEEADHEFRIGNLTLTAGTLGSQMQLSGADPDALQSYAITFLKPPNDQLPSVVIRVASPVRIAAVNQNATMLATAHEDTGIRLWSVPHGRPLGLIASEMSDIQQLRFLPGHTGLVWVGQSPRDLDSQDRFAEGFRTRTGQKAAAKIQLQDGHDRIALSSAANWPKTQNLLNTEVSADGNRVAFLQTTGDVSVWDIRSGEQLFAATVQGLADALHEQQAGDIGRTESTARSLDQQFGRDFGIAMSPDGMLLAVARRAQDKSSPSITHQVMIHDLATGEIKQFPGLTGPLAFHPHRGELVAGISGTHGIAIVDTTTGRQIADLDAASSALLGAGSTDFPGFFSFFPTKNRLVVLPGGSSSDQLQVWEAIRGGAREAVFENEIWSRYGGLRRIVFSSDGAIAVLLFNQSDVAQIVNTTSWSVTAAISARGDTVRSIDISPDGNRVATFGFWGQIDIWDTKTGNLYWRFIDRNVPIEPYWFVAFSDDGKDLVAGSAQGIIRWRADH